jgi:hypothetical protein
VVARYLPRFAALRPPPALRTLYARYVDVLRLESDALRAGNTRVLTELVTTRARPLARRLGASGCIT